MKFTYEYRTKDNVHHEGTICAPNREAVYTQLKAQGIRPGRVDIAPGFFNRLFGTGKRWLAIGVLAVALVATLAAYLAKPKSELTIATLDSHDRRQIMGDSAVIEKGVKSAWSDVFPEPGEQFLACYALPGQPPVKVSAKSADVLAALDRKIEAASGDGVETRQIKSIVEGLKEELRRYIENGGTLEKYVRRLIRRQQVELGYYQRAKREVDDLAASKAPEAEIVALWEKRNNELRRMGIRLITYPDVAENDQ